MDSVKGGVVYFGTKRYAPTETICYCWNENKAKFEAIKVVCHYKRGT